MPFRETSVVEEREEFCRLAQMPGAKVRELCRRFGVSPDRGYVWLGRYVRAGREGLEDRSRRPLTSPARSASETEAQVLAVREAQPAWGGRKIRRVLQNEGLAKAPAASTITQILRRHGKLDGPRTGQAREFVRFEHAHPNELWQMDFKGHFAMEQGRCHPLTVLDDHSRYALALQACANEQAATVRERLSGVFRRYGLPRRMLCDNGPPWGTAGSAERHTPLTVWLLDLGVEVSHGRPIILRPRARTSASTARSQPRSWMEAGSPTCPRPRRPSTPGGKSTTPAALTRPWTWQYPPAATP